MRQREQQLLEVARRRGRGLGAGGLIPDLQVLAAMQHHGLPTRPLDVTQHSVHSAVVRVSARNGDKDTRGALFAFEVA